MGKLNVVLCWDGLHSTLAFSLRARECRAGVKKRLTNIPILYSTLMFTALSLLKLKNVIVKVQGDEISERSSVLICSPANIRFMATSTSFSVFSLAV